MGKQVGDAKPNINAELESIQRETIGLFLHETNPVNGLVIVSSTLLVMPALHRLAYRSDTNFPV